MRFYVLLAAGSFDFGTAAIGRVDRAEKIHKPRTRAEYCMMLFYFGIFLSTIERTCTKFKFGLCGYRSIGYWEKRMRGIYEKSVLGINVSVGEVSNFQLGKMYAWGIFVGEKVC